MKINRNGKNYSTKLQAQMNMHFELLFIYTIVHNIFH